VIEERDNRKGMQIYFEIITIYWAIIFVDFFAQLDNNFKCQRIYFLDALSNSE